MSEHCPGSDILDRYLSNADEAVREEARDNLRRLVALAIRVNERLAAQNPQIPIRANVEITVESESAKIQI